MPRLLRDTDRRDVPWKNGQGTTRDILFRRSPLGEVLHRLSLAAIARDAPFSSFPGLDRTIVLAEGAGFALCFSADRRIEITPEAPCTRFAGEATPECRLRAGAVRALNVMSARGLPHEVQLIDIGPAAPVALPAGADRVIVCLRGRVVLGTIALERFDAAEQLGDEPLAGDGTVALVTLGTLC